MFDRSESDMILDGKPLDGRTILTTDVHGLALFGPVFEKLVDALQISIGRLVEPEGATRLGVPPIISRRVLERLGYVEAFPHLLGTLYTYPGDEHTWQELVPAVRGGQSWTTSLAPSDVAMLPAVCYHVYPQLTGTDLARPLVVDVCGYCYRHEKTAEPGRMRAFRMRELVRVDTESAVRSWQQSWVDRAGEWLRSLGLAVSVRPANDPFFGAARRLVGAVQLTEQLKWELVVEVDQGLDQAVASCNRHKDHFSTELGFTVAGKIAHTACTAFGLERIALAVIQQHGSHPGHWPDELRAQP
jgi:seryl-tRNA synthetase